MPLLSLVLAPCCPLAPRFFLVAISRCSSSSIRSTTLPDCAASVAPGPRPWLCGRQGDSTATHLRLRLWHCCASRRARRVISARPYASNAVAVW